MQYVTACHATHRRNLPSILRKGLLGIYAIARNNRVWLHDRTISGWGCVHVEERHGWREEDIVLLCCQVDRRRLRKGRREYTYCVRGDIPPENISAVVWALTGKLVTNAVRKSG